MDVCCICLSELISDYRILDCNHKLHNKCFIKLTYTQSSFFIDCPLCRQPNFNIERPYLNNKDNLRLLLSNKVGKIPCLAKTKSGERCKNNSYLFNYGCCHVHNKNIIKKKHFNLFYSYIEYVFTSNQKGFKTKLYMIDMAKKLILKHNIKKLEDLILYFTKFFVKYNYKKQGTPEKFYIENEIELPEKWWIDHCTDKKIIY